MNTSKELENPIFQNLQYYSRATLFNPSQTLPLYKLSIKPYDYYIEYTFQGDLSRMQFYQQLQKMNNLIVSPQKTHVTQIQQSFFNKIFNLSQNNKFSISCYFRYYNYTMQSWMNYQKECGSIISQAEILMIFKQLLDFHESYFQQYGQNCNVMKSELIYITPQKKLKIYPHCIQFNHQVSKKRKSNSNFKIDKQFSIETTMSNSYIQLTQENQNSDMNIKQDLRDIFILILSLISFKKYDHFWSKRHQRVLWDSVKNVLTSSNASHLSQEFINLLKYSIDNKNLEARWLLPQIEKLIQSSERIYRIIHIQKNQQLAILIDKKAKDQKAKKLQNIRIFYRKQPEKGLSKYNSF